MYEKESLDLIICPGPMTQWSGQCKISRVGETMGHFVNDVGGDWAVVPPCPGQ
jgi:hypothetical protein